LSIADFWLVGDASSEEIHFPGIPARRKVVQVRGTTVIFNLGDRFLAGKSVPAPLEARRCRRSSPADRSLPLHAWKWISSLEASPTSQKTAMRQNFPARVGKRASLLIELNVAYSAGENSQSSCLASIARIHLFNRSVLGSTVMNAKNFLKAGHFPTLIAAFSILT